MSHCSSLFSPVPDKDYQSVLTAEVTLLIEKERLISSYAHKLIKTANQVIANKNIRATEVSTLHAQFYNAIAERDNLVRKISLTIGYCEDSFLVRAAQKLLDGYVDHAAINIQAAQMISSKLSIN